MRKLFPGVLLIFFLGFLACSNPNRFTASPESFNSDGQLELRLTLDKKVYQVRVPIHARLTIKNIGLPIYIYTYLMLAKNPDGGASNNVGFNIFDAEGFKGYYIHQDNFGENYNAFKKMYTEQFITTTFNLSDSYALLLTCDGNTPQAVRDVMCIKTNSQYLQDINIVPGEYTVQAIYVNELVVNDHNPTWRGRLSSNVVKYKVASRK